MDALEAMGSAMSMRWLDDKEVPEQLVDKLLWAATRASNPGNSQLWDFVVVREPAQRKRVADLITTGFQARARAQEQKPAATVPTTGMPTVTSKMKAGTDHLITHLADVPVLIFICGTNRFPPQAPQEGMMLSAVHGAAQNLIVAARALELGAAYTTFQSSCERALKEMLGIPEETRICVTIPVGWPTRKFVELKRRPLDEVVHHDRW